MDRKVLWFLYLLAFVPGIYGTPSRYWFRFVRRTVFQKDHSHLEASSPNCSVKFHRIENTNGEFYCWYDESFGSDELYCKPKETRPQKDINTCDQFVCNPASKDLVVTFNLTNDLSLTNIKLINFKQTCANERKFSIYIIKMRSLIQFPFVWSNKLTTVKLYEPNMEADALYSYVNESFPKASSLTINDYETRMDFQQDFIGKKLSKSVTHFSVNEAKFLRIHSRAFIITENIREIKITRTQGDLNDRFEILPEIIVLNNYKCRSNDLVLNFSSNSIDYNKVSQNFIKFQDDGNCKLPMSERNNKIYLDLRGNEFGREFKDSLYRDLLTRNDTEFTIYYDEIDCCYFENKWIFGLEERKRVHITCQDLRDVQVSSLNLDKLEEVCQRRNAVPVILIAIAVIAIIAILLAILSLICWCYVLPKRKNEYLVTQASSKKFELPKQKVESVITTASGTSHPSHPSKVVHKSSLHKKSKKSAEKRPSSTPHLMLVKKSTRSPPKNRSPKNNPILSPRSHPVASPKSRPMSSPNSKPISSPRSRPTLSPNIHSTTSPRSNQSTSPVTIKPVTTMSSSKSPVAHSPKLTSDDGVGNVKEKPVGQSTQETIRQ